MYDPIPIILEPGTWDIYLIDKETRECISDKVRYVIYKKCSILYNPPKEYDDNEKATIYISQMR